MEAVFIITLKDHTCDLTIATNLHFWSRSEVKHSKQNVQRLNDYELWILYNTIHFACLIRVPKYDNNVTKINKYM